MPGAKKKTTDKKTAVKPEFSMRTDSSKGKVYMEKGVTKNMGDFNSARVTVGMELPIDFTPEELKAAKKAIRVIDEEITNELEAQVAEMLGEL